MVAGVITFITMLPFANSCFSLILVSQRACKTPGALRSVPKCNVTIVYVIRYNFNQHPCVLGMDPSMGQERRTPVTPSSSSRYHRRRSSGSRDERYRSGERQDLTYDLVGILLYPCYLSNIPHFIPSHRPG